MIASAMRQEFESEQCTNTTFCADGLRRDVQATFGQCSVDATTGACGGWHCESLPGCRYGVRIGAMPLSTCVGRAEVNLKFSAERPGTNAVSVPKW